MTAPSEYLDPARWTGEQVYMPHADYDVPLRQALGRAIRQMVPDTLMAFNYEGDQVWVQLSDGKDTRAWINAALAEIGRPALPTS
jgi:hypothetical protein